MANLTSNEYDNEPTCFKRRSQIANYKTTNIYEGALLCTEVQVIFTSDFYIPVL